MIKEIEQIIKRNKDVSAYQIKQVAKESVELYYVLRNLETAREVKISDYTVTIYKDHDNFRGQSSFSVSSAYSNEEIEEKVLEAVTRAQYVNNKFFELPMPEDTSDFIFESNIADSELKNTALNVARAIFKADVYKEGWINSSEIFVTKYINRFVNSNGIDCEYPSYRLFIEVIPTWKGKTEEVELYFSNESSNVIYDDITEAINKKLMDAKNRGNAVSIPDDLKSIDVILNPEEVKQMLSFFAEQLKYSLQYQEASHYTLNDLIQNENAQGDKLNIKALAFIDGSCDSSPIDALGTKLVDTTLVENGKVVNFYGDAKTGYYMNINKPTGALKNIDVEKGKLSIKSFKKAPYLECINFSAFQLDEYSGYYGGEVRLGLYFDGEELKPVSGFSVAGNIYEDINNMYFSKEESVQTGYRGPKYIKVKMNVNK